MLQRIPCQRGQEVPESLSAVELEHGFRPEICLEDAHQKVLHGMEDIQDGPEDEEVSEGDTILPRQVRGDGCGSRIIEEYYKSSDKGEREPTNTAQREEH